MTRIQRQTTRPAVPASLCPPGREPHKLRSKCPGVRRSDTIREWRRPLGRFPDNHQIQTITPSIPCCALFVLSVCLFHSLQQICRMYLLFSISICLDKKCDINSPLSFSSSLSTSEFMLLITFESQACVAAVSKLTEVSSFVRKTPLH